MENSTAYRGIVEHYERCLERYGDNHQGVDWPNREDADTRYRVMLDLIPVDAPRPVSLLDFGCGASHLLEYINRRGLEGIRYAGLDISEKFIALSRHKFPDAEYRCLDILRDGALLPRYDYIVMNGVFTEKVGLTHRRMWEYFKRMLCVVWPKARRGLAFNVMSKQVDWERDDLFHLPMDKLTRFLAREVSRHFIIRHDYGLYEYTVHLYRDSTSTSRGI